MIWNEKGIVLNFILAILIALIIFVPTILFASELFRLSDQGAENFRSFVRELRSFAAEKVAQKTFLLISDEKAAVFLFDNKESVFAYQKRNIVYKDASTSIYIKNYNLPFPEGKCQKAPCACLCRKFNENKVIPKDSSFDISVGVTTSTISYDVACDQLSCEDISNLPIEDSLSIYRSENDPRRTTIIFEKRGDKIIVKK